MPPPRLPPPAALFDTVDEGSYVDEVQALQAALDAHVWPALGVGPTLALALSAWVHFRCVWDWTCWGRWT